MNEDDKALEFKHAHITGQAMRDHWGPIVDRIAAETADWRDEWIYDLITENERLKYLNDLNAVPAGIIEDRGRMEERAAIVAYLRIKRGAMQHIADDLANVIEAGEHLK